MKYWRGFWERNYTFCVKCYLFFYFWNFFILFWSYWRCVFIWVGCLIWLLLISIKNVCPLVFLLWLVWHDRRKKKFSCFKLVWNHFVWVFMNMDFHWKLKIIINWDIFYIIKNNICCILDMYIRQLSSFIRNLKFSKFYLIVMYRNVIVFIL